MRMASTHTAVRAQKKKLAAQKKKLAQEQVVTISAVRTRALHNTIRAVRTCGENLPCEPNPTRLAQAYNEAAAFSEAAGAYLDAQAETQDEVIWFPDAPGGSVLPEIATIEQPAASDLGLLFQAQAFVGFYAEKRPLVWVAAMSLVCGALAVLAASVLKPFATLNPTSTDVLAFVKLFYNVAQLLVIGECSSSSPHTSCTHGADETSRLPVLGLPLPPVETLWHTPRWLVLSHTGSFFGTPLYYYRRHWLPSINDAAAIREHDEQV